MPEFQHKFAHTNGIRMHYVQAGTGPLVIFCHGFPESWYSWRHQLRAFADRGFRAIAPDQRGYGETDAPAGLEAYDLCHLVGDMVGLLYDLGEPRAIIIGHDWGSPVAWTSALLRPDLFHAVGLLSVPYLPRLWGGPRPTELMRSMVGETHNFYQLYFQQPDVPEAELEQDIRRSLLGMYSAASAEVAPDRVWRVVFSRSEKFIDTIPAPDNLPSWLTEGDLDYFSQQFSASGFRGPLNWYRNLDRNAENLAFLKNTLVRQPSVFLAGERDGVIQMYREAYDSLESSMPGLQRKVLIPGAGHWVQQEQPARVNSVLLDFCSSVQPARTAGRSS